MDSAPRSPLPGLGSLIAVLVLLALAAPPVPAAAGDPVPDVQALIDAQPLSFVPNRGQWPDEVLFRAGAGPLTTWFTRDGWTQSLEELVTDPDTGAPEAISGVAVRMSFPGSSFVGTPEGEQPTSELRHFLLGDDPSAWVTSVPVFRRLRYPDLYPGVDLVARASGGHLAYDLEVAAHGDLSAVSMQAEGALAGHVAEDGALVLDTTLGPLRQSAPVSWYELAPGSRLRAEVGFVLHADGQRWSFSQPDGPQGTELVIDPEVTWASFVGGTSFDYVQALQLAPDGGVVVGGFTHGGGFPATPGAFDESLAGSRDAFVAKLSADGGGLLFATYLGGMGEEEVRDLALDASGEIVVGGFTSSTDFPATGGAYDQAQAGGNGVLDSDGYVARLSADGASLVFASYLGGFGDDLIEAVGVDAAGVITVGGKTSSPNYPTSPTAYGKVYGGGSNDVGDAFLSRLSAAGDALLWSTFLGAEGNELVNALAVGTDGTVTAAGWTDSVLFPTTEGAFDNERNGFSDAWVARVDATGSALLFSTFLGGGADDNATALDLFDDGSVLAAGTTLSNDFPITNDAIDGSFAGGGFFGDAWILHLSDTGAAVLFATYLGGVQDEYPTGVFVDVDGTVVVAGWSSSSDAPVTLDAPQPNLSGTGDAYVARLDITEGVLLAATYLGGNKVDKAFAADLGANGRVLLGGFANSADFPVTEGAFDTSFSGFPGLIGDAFVSSLDFSVVTGVGGGSPWIDIGSELSAGGTPAPGLVGVGQVAPGASGSLDLIGAPAGRPGILFVGVEEANVDFKGGNRVPLPVDLVLLFVTNPLGGTSIPYAWPESSPSGFVVYLHAWITDPAGPEGWTASNALFGEIP